ncbi:MAG: hypothetical protein MMC23_003477 [Stictis urceolatum]|nr:hypothetical protein [Stictis urceolata]
MDNEDAFNYLFEDPPPRRTKVGIGSAPPLRTHDQMLQDDGRTDSFLHDIPRYSGASSASLNRHFPPPPLSQLNDSRRQTMSNSVQPEIIDLTGESPPRPLNRDSRNGAGEPAQSRRQRPEVIDLEDDEPGGGHNRDVPDIEFIRVNTLRSPTPPPGSLFRGLPRYHWDEGRVGREARDRAESGWMGQFGLSAGLRNILTPNFLRRPTAVPRPSRPGDHHTHIPPPAFHTLRPDVPPQRFEPPNLDYVNPGFAMQPPTPSYQPPEPAREGFTRKPAEGDILVCPNCDDELCTGDTDIKRQIWVIKSCGHVYCGQCATSRHASKQKRKSKDTFSKCVVEGCTNKSASSQRAMIQIYI